MPEPSLDMRLAQRIAPDRPHVMYQNWRHLLFLHWRWDVDDIARRLPPGLEVDLYDGAAWLGIVPLFIEGLRPRAVPSIPGVSNFMELNLRTYVYDSNGRAGIWFFSLDAGSPPAAWFARTFLKLPYHAARMIRGRGPAYRVDFCSRRRGTAPMSRFSYRPLDALPPAEPGTLEFFLIERYRLFAESNGKLYSAQVHHYPYPLTTVEVPEWDATVMHLDGFRTPDRLYDHAIFSPGVDMMLYAPD